MSSTPNPSIVLSFEEARSCVERHALTVQAPGTEIAELLACFGRVLAEVVLADRDLPPFPRSTRDGYAVHAADLAKVPCTLDVIAEIKAGENPSRIPEKIERGQAVAIMTGAPVPSGADSVVMVEYTSERDRRVEFNRPVALGENIVPVGAESRKESVLLRAGTRLNDVAIALAASVGKSRLKVYQRPRIAVLSTGDEIVDIDAIPGPTQIRNSNSYSLSAQVANAGGEPVLLAIAPDERNALREMMERGLQSDLLLLTGGVSMGRYDLVEQVISELNAKFFFTGAKIQPGRPVVFGKCRCGARAAGGELEQKYFFGLPGNPVSTMVTFELFARPMLEALAGMSPRKLAFVHAKLKSEIRVKPGLKRFLPAILSGEYEQSEVELVAWQGSGDIAATAKANCYIVIPPDRESIPAGEFVSILARTM